MEKINIVNYNLSKKELCCQTTSCDASHTTQFHVSKVPIKSFTDGGDDWDTQNDTILRVWSVPSRKDYGVRSFINSDSIKINRVNCLANDPDKGFIVDKFSLEIDGKDTIFYTRNFLSDEGKIGWDASLSLLLSSFSCT